MRARILFLAVVAVGFASGQSVLSVRSGLINFSEGEVYLADLPLEQKAGKYPELREGAELRTEAGRAEVLLTPGILLRVGPDSAIRMLSASLIDTRVEFRRGSAIVEVSEDPKDTSTRIVYRDYQIKFPKRGSFRIDSMPREFRVYEGEAEISYLNERTNLTKGRKVALYGGIEAETLRRSITDGLDEWSMRRDTQLAAENPPPGDLNGAYDPTFLSLPSIPFSYSNYGGFSSTPYTNYSAGFISPYGSFATYGFVPYQPIYVFVPTPYRPVNFPTSPVRQPVRIPIFGSPSRPVVVRPIAPARPVAIGRPK